MINNCFVIIHNSNIDDWLSRMTTELELFLKTKISVSCQTTICNKSILSKQNLLHYHGLLYCQNDGGIVYSDNTGDAHDAFIYSLAQKYKAEIVHCRIYEEKGSESCYITYFKNGEQQRVIYALRDDDESWMYYDKGNIIESESIDYYLNIIKAKRFTKLILMEYLANTGIPIMDDEFWKPTGEVYLLDRANKAELVNCSGANG